MTTEPPVLNAAYYYPEPFWLAREGGWVKSLLLFFDQIAILLPNYMRGQHSNADPTLVEPLEDRGLLRVLEPEWFVDEETTIQLTAVIQAIIDNGAFDELSEAGTFAELSMSRMGYGANHDVAQAMHDSLAQRGLAAESQDGFSVPLHPTVRAVYLVVLAQLARHTGARHGLDLQPITNGRNATHAFDRFLQLGPMPSRGQVVSFDLEVVGVDLDVVPLDEVLLFRDENRDAHRRYMQNLRSFALELSMFDETERTHALVERRAELVDQADDLRRRASQAWRSPKAVTGFALGLAGAAWSIATHDPVPAALTALGAGLGMLPSAADGSAYSYLFTAQRDLQ